MVSSKLRELILAAGFTLSLSCFLVLGCGSSQEAAYGHASTSGPPEVPEQVVAQLESCAKQGADHLTSSSYAIMIDVTVAEDGRARRVNVKDSMLGDRGIEACMARAVRGMTLPTSILATRSRHTVSEGRPVPDSRALVGNPLLLGSGVVIELLPIVIVAAGVTIIVGITVELVSEMSKPPDISDEEYERCAKVKNLCLQQCEHLLGKRKLYGDPHKKCWKECLDAEGCWGVGN